MSPPRVLEKLPVGVMPMLIAAVLSLPGYAFPFLWDDYDFLGRAQVFAFRDLAPSSASMYWRPISRELYFAFLYQVGPLGPVVGHTLNLLLLVLSTLLVTIIATRMAGRTAGLFAGLLFATYPHMPLLVSWVSGAQDLLAMAFALVAIRLRLEGRLALSVLALLLAVLSKETALATVPGLIAMDWLLGRKPRRLLSGILAYGSVGCLWAFVHPGVRVLLARRLEAEPGGAVGIHASTLVSSLRWGLASLLNVPQEPVDPYAITVDWFPLLLALGLCGVAAVLATGIGTSPTVHPRRISLLAAALCILPLGLTSALVSIRSPYYACFPFIGASLGLGTLLSRWRTTTALPLLLLFVGLGGVARATRIDPEVPTVRNLTPAAVTLKAVEREFKQIVPNIEGKATAYVSVQSSGYTSLEAHMHRNQVLRVWYRNPELATLAPQQSIADPGRELVFWISPSYHVYSIDPRSLAVRGVGPAPSRGEYEKVLRRFAVGRAAVGDLSAAVGVLTRIDVHDETMRAYDYRLAAALLIASGEAAAAETLLVDVPPFAWEPALDFIMTTIGEYFPKVDRDEVVMRVFGITPDDHRATRSLMLGLDYHGWPAPALRFATRVLASNPSDPDAKRILEKAALAGHATPLTIVVPHRQ